MLTRIKLDEAAEELVARSRASTLDDVPPAGTWVKLALTGNMSTGGTSIDRTIEAHPDNVEIAETAAQVVGLDIAGIDFICPDIATPGPREGRRDRRGQRRARASGCTPTRPRASRSTSPGRSSICCSRAGSSARIPIIAVTGTNGKTTTVRMIAHILKLMGRRVGMTSTDGIVIDGRLIRKGDMSGPKSAQMVLQNPTVDTAVFEVARGGILREGLGYDRNDVAVVTNVTGDHLGSGRHRHASASWPTSRASSSRPCRARAPRCSTPTTRSSTGWPATAPAASCCSRWPRPRARTASTASTGTPAAAAPRSCLEHAGEGELIVLRLGSRTMPVLYTHLIPATFGGRARMNVANALAAAAAAWAAGAHLHDIRQGLRTFTTSFFQAPGPAQPARGRRLPGRHRLLPQRRRHAPAGRVRRTG